MLRVKQWWAKRAHMERIRLIFYQTLPFQVLKLSAWRLHRKSTKRHWARLKANWIKVVHLINFLSCRVATIKEKQLQSRIRNSRIFVSTKEITRIQLNNHLLHLSMTTRILLIFHHSHIQTMMTKMTMMKEKAIRLRWKIRAVGMSNRHLWIWI